MDRATWVRWRGCMLVSLATSCAAVGVARAQAVLPNPDLGLMSSGGRVFDIAVQSDGKIIIGGDFTTVNGVPRNNIARLNSDGTLDMIWNPNSSGGIRTIALSGGSVFVGGGFTDIGGQSRNSIAQLDLTTGNATSWNPGANNLVSDIVVSGGLVYAGGFFTTIGGQLRNRIAALDMTTGNATAWDPNANDLVSALALYGGVVYAGGSFTTIGGQSRNYIAALDMTTGNATTWNPNSDGVVHTLAVFPAAAGGMTAGVHVKQGITADEVHVGGSFWNIGGQPRNYIAALDITTGNATSWNPDLGGPVFALGRSGDRVFIGGNYSQIGGVNRDNIAAVDATSGAVLPWNPGANGPVRSVNPSFGVVYTGGDFDAAAGKKSLSVAWLDETTGSHVPGFRSAVGHPGVVFSFGWQPDGRLLLGGSFAWSGRVGVECGNIARLQTDGTLDQAFKVSIRVNGSIDAIAVFGSTAYVGGQFTKVNDQPRQNLAKMDLSSSTLSPWDPSPNGGVGGLHANTVYAAGAFTNIGGQPRNRIAALDSVTGLATSWNPNADAGVRGIAVSGNTVYAFGAFTNIGGQPRNRIAALDATTGLATSWNPNADDLVFAVAVSGNTVYVGGLFSNIGGQPRNRIAALDAATGLATPWNPDATNSLISAVLALAVSGNTVYAGGSFQSIGGQIRNRIAALDATTGVPTAWNPNASFEVLALLVSNGTVYVGGTFETIVGQARNGLAALTEGLGGPAVGFSPTGLTFADQFLSTTSAPQTITLTNTGSMTLNIVGIAASGDFAQSNTCPAALAPGAGCPIQVTFTPTLTGPRGGAITVTSDAPGTPHFATLSGTGINGPFDFYTLTPCRVLDTRLPDGPLGGPALAADANRTFTLAGNCGIPPTARVVSLNITVTQPSAQGDLRLYPGGTALPTTSSINYRGGQTRANNVSLPLGTGGTMAVQCVQFGGTVHFLVDVNGYYE